MAPPVWYVICNFCIYLVQCHLQWSSSFFFKCLNSHTATQLKRKHPLLTELLSVQKYVYMKAYFLLHEKVNFSLANFYCTVCVYLCVFIILVWTKLGILKWFTTLTHEFYLFMKWNPSFVCFPFKNINHTNRTFWVFPSTPIITPLHSHVQSTNTLTTLTHFSHTGQLTTIAVAASST